MGKRRIKFDLLVHDLKGPLAVIEAGIISLINKKEKYGPLTDTQLKVLKRVLRNTLTTKTLVNDALEVGRSSEGITHKTSFKLSDFIEHAFVEIFDLTNHEKTEKIRGCSELSVIQKALVEEGIFIEIIKDSWCREICLDESKMSQILRNLLINALKYRKTRIDLKIELKDNFLVICVRDDGEGIPEKYHEKIFECYFQMDGQTDYCVRGHGLGLAGVMALVEDMGGELSLKSDAGQGTTFFVGVPLC